MEQSWEKALRAGDSHRAREPTRSGAAGWLSRLVCEHELHLEERGQPKVALCSQLGSVEPWQVIDRLGDGGPCSREAREMISH